MLSNVQLREVQESDLPLFYEHQHDPIANRMAAFPARERAAFMAHWRKILPDETLLKKTILLGGRVVGNVVSFERAGQREVGYWLGRDAWGQGIATRALALFLAIEKTRPLFARVAKHNAASRRVLEKCGFVVAGVEWWLPDKGGEAGEDFILKLSPEVGQESP